MALQWQWNEKVGTAEIFNYDKVVTYQLYKGNAFLIMLYEYTTDDGKEMYDVHSFFVDESHAKRMLGLIKCSDGTKSNCMNTERYQLRKIRLNKKMYGDSNTKKLVDMLIKAFDHIEIEIYSEEGVN